VDPDQGRSKLSSQKRKKGSNFIFEELSVGLEAYPCLDPDYDSAKYLDPDSAKCLIRLRIN
jgi:hypothetical protein